MYRLRVGGIFMESFDATLQSESLNEELDIIVYGSTGRPVIVFPTFDFSAGSWETGGMLTRLSELVDSGRIQLFCTDSIDGESWYAQNSALDYRSERQEAYFSYVTDILVPYVRSHSSSQEKPLVVGCGIGATNAAVAMLRRPDLFGGLLALSGVFDARFLSKGSVNQLWLKNSPIDIARSLDKTAITALEKLPLAFAYGQGQGEDAIDSMRAVEATFQDLGLDATFEYWGYDVTHGWPWWQEMASQLLPELLVPAGLARRRYLTAKSHRDLEEHKLDEVTKKAERSKRDEAQAKQRLKKEEHNVLIKSKSAEEAAKTATAAWEQRNKVAAELASLDKKAGQLQAAVDEATKARSDAEWFAGEARNDYEVAHAARLAVDADMKVAKNSAEAIEEQCKILAEKVRRFGADAAASKNKKDAAKKTEPASNTQNKKPATKKSSSTREKKSTTPKKPSGTKDA